MAYTELEIIAETEYLHVNNVTLYGYLDQARREWYLYCRVLGVEGVLVHISVDYRKEAFHHDKLKIRTFLDRVGNTSFTLRQTVENIEGELILSAESVLTTIDVEARTKVSVPDEIRGLLHSDSVLKYQ